jgi:hypothetical protein
MLCVASIVPLGAMERKESANEHKLTPTTIHLSVTGSTEDLKKHLKKKKVSYWKRKKIVGNCEKQAKKNTQKENELLEIGTELVQEANRKFYTPLEEQK